jgi:7,8-dihydroneopterin aldolase/epimerase/oxygenase
MDRIALRGMRVYGRHGWAPGERERAQPFEIELEAEVDLLAAQASDDLADTIDYATLHRRVADVVENTSYALLERLASDILDVVFQDGRIARAVVTISKPAILDGATPSVTFDRINPNYRRS